MAQKAKAKSKQTQAPDNLARRIISHEFMAMTHGEMDALDKQIDGLLKQVELDMKKAPTLKNEHYRTGDVVEEVPDDEN